jgi:vacuolar-type H+-ATPase subunit F/Vma7
MSGYTINVVCQPGIALGFALAGVPTTVADSREGAQRVIAELAARPDAGVLLVQEDLLAERNAESAGTDHDSLPMIVPFPGPTHLDATDRAEAYVAEILRQAIGYRVRIR